MPARYLSTFVYDFFLPRRETMVLEGDLASSSFRTDKNRLESVILPALGSHTLVGLKSHEIDEFLAREVRSGKSPATRNRYRALLYAIFKYAVFCELRESNPVARVKILRERLKVRPTLYWDRLEYREKYLEAMQHVGRPWHQILAAVLVLAGCRIGEALALTWEDINWEANYARVWKIIEPGTDELKYRTKGQRAGGEFLLILPSRLIKILESHYNARKFPPGSFITANLKGRRLAHGTFSRVHHEAIKQAGLPRITVHDLRRTFSANALKAGLTEKELQKRLAHKTAAATQVYAQMDVAHLVERAKQTGA